MLFSREDMTRLYGRDAEALAKQAKRYAGLAERFAQSYPAQGTPRFFSAPGRTEIGGNHTDHQSGRVLAAAVNVDTLAAAAPNGTSLVRLLSEGFAPVALDLSDLSPNPAEHGGSAAIIRGCAAGMAQAGHAVGGFDAVVTSDVLSGSGLSSSAAFEVLICAVLDGLFGKGGMDPILRAKISQHAENQYFGKPSGLMDQMASSVGGLVTIDFGTEDPEILPLSFDFEARGYALCVVSTGGSHDHLTAAYASIRYDMEKVAAQFGEKRLRAVDPEAFEAEIPALRRRVSERALLRAMHFFGDNARVPEQVSALLKGDISRFFSLVIASGESSWKLLQNIYTDPKEQPLALALALSERMLAGRGAWRVHGGGFAGTILAFVPLDLLKAYQARMDAVFGAGACCPLGIRPVGAYEVREA